MHQKCHIDSQLQRKSFFLLQLQVLKKLFTEKRGMVTRKYTRDKLIVTRCGLNEDSANKDEKYSEQLRCLGALSFTLYFHSKVTLCILSTVQRFQSVLARK